MVQAGKQYFGDKTRPAKVARAVIYGNLDRADCQAIAGWAADFKDYAPQRITLFSDGKQFALVTADQFRADLAAAHHGHGKNSFEIATPAVLQDGREHAIAAFVVPSGEGELEGSPRSITCGRGSRH